MPTQLRIAIVGAGPGGLTLARILACHGVTVRVFERERGPLERPQGGTLDLHAESGQLALQHAGLEHAFQRIARYEDQGSRLMDQHGHLLFEDPNPAAADRPEVDRTALRQILLDALPEVYSRCCSTVQISASRSNIRRTPETKFCSLVTSSISNSISR